MRVIANSTLTRFVVSLRGQPVQKVVKDRLEAWHSEVKRATWQSSAELKRAFATASILNAERVVFNIHGNHFRLVASIDYARQTLFVKWIGNHVAYDKINARTVEYEAC